MNSVDTTRYSRLLIALQNYLLGARYYTALKAFDYAKKTHCNFRKDGITPEFQHQVEIALFITTLRDIQNEELCIVAALLHDTLEDYDHITIKELAEIIEISQTTPIVKLSKTIKGVKINNNLDDYFSGIAFDQEASIVKGSDRIHNLTTMKGVFSLSKQEQYVNETITYFLPMLKTAAGKFPMQHLAYMNIRTILKTQIELINATIEAGYK